MEVVENIDINYSIDTKEMDIDDRNEVNTNASDGINVWSYIMKQQTEKAKYNIRGVILSRKHATISDLSIEFIKLNLLEKLQQNQVRNFISVQLTKKNKFGLLIKCTTEDGRSFSGNGQSGILKIFNHLVQCKRNTV